jgi:hypothetical protein
MGDHTLQVVVSGPCADAGDTVTNNAVLTVQPATSAAGPTDLVRYSGQRATFSTAPVGNTLVTYQWRKDGVDIIDANNSTYIIPSVSVGDAATYSVVVAGSCASVTNSANLTVNDCMPLTSGSPQLNPQTGLFEQKVRVTNPTDATLTAVDVSVLGLRADVRVYNASGDNSGVPFVKFGQPLDPGQAGDLTIEYYVPLRQAPESSLCARPALTSSPVQPTGTSVTIDRTMRMPDGSIMIEFPSVPGEVYAIEYCDDFRTWKTVIPNVSSGANRIQWIDNGQPKTECFPTERPLRFYRVVTGP